MRQFQSQTGSQALSDYEAASLPVHQNDGFNPKREARPSQTTILVASPECTAQFQSQTGSQALSDTSEMCWPWRQLRVSIPNGKPGPLRHLLSTAERERDMFQSQTGSQALSDGGVRAADGGTGGGFNPKREARPSQTYWSGWLTLTLGTFQSQTGSQALSDAKLRKEGDMLVLFQSQTGSQALSDQVFDVFDLPEVTVSIPNGKPGPLRPGPAQWPASE